MHGQHELAIVWMQDGQNRGTDQVLREVPEQRHRTAYTHTHTQLMNKDSFHRNTFTTRNCIHFQTLLKWTWDRLSLMFENSPSLHYLYKKDFWFQHRVTRYWTNLVNKAGVTSHSCCYIRANTPPDHHWKISLMQSCWLNIICLFGKQPYKKLETYHYLPNKQIHG